MGMRAGDKPLNAILYAEDGLSSPLGKTAHGLLRHSPRYRILSVVDSTYVRKTISAATGRVPVARSVTAAIKSAVDAEVLVIGIAPTGLSRVRGVIAAARTALSAGLSVHNGLHIFLSEIPELAELSAKHHATIIDIRIPPNRPLRMFSGAIASIAIPRLLVTGQDAAVGKRTACVRLAAYLAPRINSCLIGTGQTAWLQAFSYGIRLDALPIDFVTGELEGAIVQAAKEQTPDLIIVEGQGSLLNPGYGPETLALIAAARPQAIVYVAAPGRNRFVDFPRYRLPDMEHEIRLLEALARAPVIGLVVHGNTKQRRAIMATRRPERPLSYGANGDLAAVAEAVVEALC